MAARLARVGALAALLAAPPVAAQPYPVAWPPPPAPPSGHAKAPDELPTYLDYEAGDPIPPGYRLSRGADARVVTLGVVMLSGAYVGVAVATTAATLMSSRAENDTRDLVPAFIPIGGPFVAAASDVGGGPRFWLILDGTLQAAGAGLILAGMTIERERLVLSDPSPYRALGFSTPGAGLLWPKVIAARERVPVPPGWRVEDQPRQGLVLAGAIVFAASYGVSALIGATGASEGSDGEPVVPLLIPIAGPLITIGTAVESGEAGQVAALVADSAVQSAGIALVIAGLTTTRRVLVRERVPSWSPELTVRPTALGVRWRF